MKFNNPTIKLLLRNYKSIWALVYANTLIGWDTETYMPKLSINSRSDIQADIDCYIQKQLTDSEFLTILDEAKTIRGLNIYEKKVVYKLSKTVDEYLKLPQAFISSWSKLISKSSTIWAEAREKNSFEIFKPYLKQIIELTKKKANYIGYKDDMYDAIFNTYEDGITKKELDKYFNDVKNFYKNIDFNKLKNKKSINFSRMKYSKNQMLLLNQKVLEFLGHDKNRFRLDISSHPFSLFLSKDDIRLTTRYPKTDFGASLLPTIHEFGHGLFSSNVDKEFEATPLWPETSYSLHESQSRFWENIIGRSYGFIKNFINDLRKLSKDFKNYDVIDFYNYLNKIEPSLIRVDADEFTYHLHILIRYELESLLLNDSIKVKDLPFEWNKLYKKYLNIEPNNYSEGVLQDIHWSFGNIGYFPTYSLGSSLSAVWFREIKKDLKINFEDFNKNDILKINNWFKDNIHQYGGMYSLEEIVKLVTNRDFSFKDYIIYAKEKFL